MNMIEVAADWPNAVYEAALDRAIQESQKIHPLLDFTDPEYKTVYLAGKMSGLPHFGFDKFAEAAQDLREREFLVLSPAEMDDKEECKHAWESPDGKTSRSTKPRSFFLRRDYLIVCEVDMGVVLPTWRDSEGALGETLIMFSLDKPVLQYPDLHQLTWDDHPYSQYWSDLARRDLMAMRTD